MNKRVWQIGIGVICFAAAYLAAAHFYIYFMIGKEALKATDNRHSYTINPQLPADRGLVYVALGDSLTSGVGTEQYEDSYSYLVAQKMAGQNKRVTNLNFSYPGARTDDLIRDLLAKAIADDPRVVTLLVGTNDVHGKVSRQEFVNNYRLIAQELRQGTQAKLNFISIPNIGSDGLLVPPYNAYYRNRVNDFNQEIRKIAREFGANYIDLATHTEELSHGQGDYYSADRFHPSKSGYRIWADYIYEHLDY